MSNEKLFKVAVVLMGQSPPSSSCSANGDGIPFIQGNAEFGVRFPAPKLKCITPLRVAEQGDLLLSVRAPVGEMNQANQKMVIGRGLSAIRFPAEDQTFAWHSLNSAVSRLNRVAQGSTFVAVNRNDVESLDIPWFPDKILRQNIAYVLDTIDETITQTEAVIAKLKQVRAGMLHDLLSYGLDENGQLRDPVAHPEHFKDSPLGRIPEEWNVVRLIDIAEVFGGKRLPNGHSYATLPTGYRYLRVLDFFERPIVYSELAIIRKDTFLALSRYEIKNGEIYISIAGSLGYVGVMRQNSNDRYILTENAARISILRSFIPDFLSMYMNGLSVKKQINAEKGIGAGVPKLALHRIERLWIAQPKLDEQEAIISTIAQIDHQLEAVFLELLKLKSLKSGLQADLLSGRVRVPESIMDSVNSRMTRADEGGADDA